MAYASLSIDLKAQLANLQTGMDKAVRLAEKNAARIESAFNSIKGVAAGIGGVLAAGIGGATFSSFILQVNDALLAIKDLSEGTGSSVENISALENVLRANNRTLAEAQPILVKFNGALKEADGKNGISQALKAIGLSAEELRKLDPVVALQQVGRALQGYEDDANKARLVQELFGKSVAEVIPFLNDLADSQLKATDGIRQATEEADRFEKNLAKLRKEAGDLGRTLAGPVVDGLNKLFATLNGGNASGELDRTRKQIQLLTKYINENGSSGGLPQMVMRLKELRDREAELLGGLPNGGRRPPNEGGGGLATLRRLPDLAGQGGRAAAGGRASAGPKEFVGPEIPQAVADALRAIESTDFNRVAALRDQLEQLLAVERAGGASPAVAEAIAKTRQQLEELDPAARKAAEEAKRLQDILNDTPGGALRAVLGDIELINRAFADGKIDAQTWAEAVRSATDPLRKGGEGGGTAVEDIGKQLGLVFSSAAEDAIVFGRKASDVLKSLEQDILRLLTRKFVTTPLLGALDGLLGGGGAGGGFDLSKLFGKAGDFFGGLFSGFFADGGFIPPGRWGIAGERGPEPVFGGRTGATVRPASSGMQVSQTFVIQGGADRNTQQQVFAAAARGLAMAQRNN